MTEAMPSADQRYTQYDPFVGDEGVATLRQVKLVTTRKEQQCMRPEGEHHTIPAGTRARFEKALIDGDYWGRYYTCTACMDRWFAEYDGEGDDE